MDEIIIRQFAEQADIYVKHFRHLEPMESEQQLLIFIRTMRTYAHGVLHIKHYVYKGLHEYFLNEMDNFNQWLPDTNMGLEYIVKEYKDKYNGYIRLDARDAIAKELHDSMVEQYYKMAKDLITVDSLLTKEEVTQERIEKCAKELMQGFNFDATFVKPSEANTLDKVFDNNPQPDEPTIVGTNFFLPDSEKKS